MIMNEDGTPRGVADISRIQSDATILMYQYAAAAGNDEAVDAVAEEWVNRLDPDAMGYTSAAALSLLTRNVLAPMLDLFDQLLPDLDFRATLAKCRDDTIEALR
ncbi:hypothetical protein [Rhodococcus sp. JG-3]|uniref:hypothetical protein n=1 Tax=Rhodococcus sp. JG-3 TaxID=1305835 RepID=UPI001268E743|nr:hypothetical protein [Rhodococcus sp. JG-3]